jgi:hypothetical protein
MNIPLIDKSNYLRGLLILAKKDNNISQIEKDIIYNVGVQLGFSSTFCQEIIKTLLQNECLNDDPIKFVNYSVAQSFVSDGLIISSTGKLINATQLIWLKNLASINGIHMGWFRDELLKCNANTNHLTSMKLSIYSII